MNVHVRPVITPEAEETLEDLADSLAIPESRYEQAERSYKALGDWLNRPASSMQQFDPQVHVQGSFGLGTVIPPISDGEHYDVDAVCEFRKLSKSQTTQQNLKQLLGDEMKLYAHAQNMNKPVGEHRRCWRLDYADGAQFHMDVTPGLLNSAEQRALLLAHGLDARFADTAIAITDIDHHAYRIVSSDWPRSNPRGYLKWFLSRMEVIFEERKRELIRKGVRAGTEPIPFYAVRTPLQSAVMILKRHRDIMFVARSDERPISIILTTLAAHAYGGEAKISDAIHYPERYGPVHRQGTRRQLRRGQPERSHRKLRGQVAQTSGASGGVLRMARPGSTRLRARRGTLQQAAHHRDPRQIDRS
ncbi:nucleotidyltransferase [Bradyrhizobium sp. NAS80.1]|uniref:nucleotidyltransferase domain-containing protein n=1 Tax=Bradyrhizobium sp. NAS80.1 TaxID=1680159 RepID=UPI000AB7F807|nr:nucleotidyltransferase [Bradyrhizobium sp. NAS80.1]